MEELQARLQSHVIKPNRTILMPSMPDFDDQYEPILSLGWTESNNKFQFDQFSQHGGKELHITSVINRGPIIPQDTKKWLEEQIYSKNYQLLMSEWPFEWCTLRNELKSLGHYHQRQNHHFLLHLPTQTTVFQCSSATVDIGWGSHGTVADGMSLELHRNHRFQNILPCLRVRRNDTLVEYDAKKHQPLSDHNCGYSPTDIPLLYDKPDIDYFVLLGPITFHLLNQYFPVLLTEVLPHILLPRDLELIIQNYVLPPVAPGFPVSTDHAVQNWLDQLLLK